MKKNTQKIKPTGVKKFIFNSFLISMPIIILLIIELFLRIINYGDNYNLFLDFPGKELGEYRYINPEIGKKYFQKLEYNKPCGDMFLKEKPKNGFRVFVLGSSSVLGFPYNQNLMFTRILQERLQDCYPDKKVEVINTAITAINSYTLLDFTDDILKEKPDAILIYAGHNEFYGALGIGSVEKTFTSRTLNIIHLHLLSSKVYQLIRNMIGGIGKSESVRGSLMKAIANNKEIPYKSDVYNKTIETYEKNIGEILEKAKRKNVPVFISEVISNVKDLKPFCSLNTPDFPSATESYDSAINFENEGKYTKAKEYYYNAKDLDCIRFRASEDINKTIHKLAAKYNACLIPMKSIFETSSPNELIGFNLVTEHVHPNIAGYFLIADAFFNEITKSNITGEKLNPIYYKNSAYYQKNWGYTEIDSLAGVILVNTLIHYWPFQSFESSPTQYIQSYKPKSIVDSLAFVMVTGSLKMDDAHLMLADFYKQKGDYYKAFREYYANIKYDPFQVSYYNDAVNCLTHTNDFPLALKLVNRSLELKETVNACLVKSEILLLKGEYTEAVQILNKASEIDKSESTRQKTLIKLCKIYYYSGENNKFQEKLNELRKIDPEYQIAFPKNKPVYAEFVPMQVEVQLSQALELYRTGNDDAALSKLLKTLEIKETSIANRYIGVILMKRNDKNAITYYLKAYPDYKKDIGFLFDLGILYKDSEELEKAKEIVQEMKLLDPDNEKITMLEERITIP